MVTTIYVCKSCSTTIINNNPYLHQINSANLQNIAERWMTSSRQAGVGMMHPHMTYTPIPFHKSSASLVKSGKVLQNQLGNVYFSHLYKFNLFNSTSNRIECATQIIWEFAKLQEMVQKREEKELEKNLKCMWICTQKQLPVQFAVSNILVCGKDSNQPTFTVFYGCDADLPQAMEPQLNLQGIGRRETGNLTPAKGHCQGTGLSKSCQGRRPPLTGPPLYPRKYCSKWAVCGI
jgi:hypothetical protein